MKLPGAGGGAQHIKTTLRHTEALVRVPAALLLSQLLLICLASQGIMPQDFGPMQSAWKSHTEVSSPGFGWLTPTHHSHLGEPVLTGSPFFFYLNFLKIQIKVYKSSINHLLLGKTTEAEAGPWKTEL